MAKAENHLGEQSIPARFQIYEERLEAAGVQFYKSQATAFAGNGGSLELQREPHNPYDANAIALIGCYKGWLSPKRNAVGHVPKEVAAQLARSRLAAQVRPRLRKTWIGNSAYVEIVFQIVGPKDRFADYLRARLEK